MRGRLSQGTPQGQGQERTLPFRPFEPGWPMDVLVFVVQRLFSLHNWIYRRTRLDRLLPRQPPPVPADEAAYGGEWGYFTSRGERLFYRRWLPADEPRGVLVSVHGAGAHGGHFAVIGKHLSPRGLGFYSPDLPGHGLSEGERGAMHDTEAIVRAIHDSLAFVAEQHPDRPVYVLGESLGALQGMELARRASRPKDLAGLVLSGPELVPRQTTPAPEGTPVWRQALIYFRYLLYGLFLSRWRVVDIAGREELVTRRPEQAEFAKRDPLRNNRLSVQTMVEAYRLIRSAFRLARRTTLPTLILQAGGDLVTDPAAAQRLRDALASPDKELVYFPDARHGLFYDPDTPRVLETLSSWLDRQISPTPAGTR